MKLILFTSIIFYVSNLFSQKNNYVVILDSLDNYIINSIISNHEEIVIISNYFDIFDKNNLTKKFRIDFNPFNVKEWKPIYYKKIDDDKIILFYLYNIINSSDKNIY